MFIRNLGYTIYKPSGCMLQSVESDHNAAKKPYWQPCLDHLDYSDYFTS